MGKKSGEFEGTGGVGTASNGTIGTGLLPFACPRIFPDDDEMSDVREDNLVKFGTTGFVFSRRSGIRCPFVGSSLGVGENPG